jgi:hypothetical protein
MQSEEITLESYRLIIGPEDIELEAEGSVSEYITERASRFTNKLGLQGKIVIEFDVVKDPLSEGWIIICMCERRWR